MPSPLFESFISGSPLGTRTPNLPSLGGVPEVEGEGGFLESALDVLEFLDRPRAAISEGVGAAVEGADISDAVTRGLSGAPAVYGTLGQQLIPSDETDDADVLMEGVKGAARLGIDILTDPTILIGALPVRKALGLGVRGVEKLARAATKRHSLQFPQWMARYAIPAAGQLKLYGGVPGKKAAAGITEWYNGTKTATGNYEAIFQDIVNATGMGKKAAKPLRSQAFDLIDKGAIGTHQNPKVNEFAKQVQEKILQPIGKQAEDYKDLVGKGLEIVNPTLRGQKGYKQPFKALDDYVPRMINSDTLETWANKAVFHKAVTDFAKLNKITFLDAERQLQLMRNVTKASNLEYARHLELPAGWVETDLLEVVPRYVERVFSRLSFGTQFGLDGKHWKKLLASARMKGLDSRVAKELDGIGRGIIPRDELLDGVARKIMGFQVMTKMGFLSSLSNLSQSSNTIIRDGGVNFLKGILRSTTNEGKRAGVVAFQRGVRDDFNRLLAGKNSWVARYLHYTGFTPVEKMNRILAANSGIVHVEQSILRQIQRNALKLDDLPDMLQRGMTPENWEQAIRSVQATGKLPIKIADRVGFLASEMTQHATHWKDLPIGWQTPMMRVVFQYKNFIYQQSRFLGREILKPAWDYFGSDGKRGTIAPLLRSTAAFGLGGQFVAHLRDQARQGVSYLTGLEHEPREIPESWPSQILHDMLYVGGLGVAGDLVESATRRDLKGWLLGPTIGDVTDLVEGGAVAVDQMAEGASFPSEQFFHQLSRRIPAFGSVMPRESVGKRFAEFIDGI